MVKLTQEIKDSLTGVKTAFVATAAKDGTPNVVPIGAYKLLDDETMLISDQFFNKTLKNLKENSKIAFTYWGEKGGYQIKGTVTIHTNDKVFEDDVAWMKEIRPNLKPKSAVIVKITDVYSVKPGGDEPGKKIL